jgi:hypothetical protein
MAARNSDRRPGGHEVWKAATKSEREESGDSGLAPASPRLSLVDDARRTMMHAWSRLFARVAMISGVPKMHGGGAFGVRGRADLQRRFVAIPIAFIAMVLLILGIPRTVGVILSARSDPVLRKLQDHQPVQTDELMILANAQEAGRFWLADGRLRTDLGLAYLLIAEKLPRTDPNVNAYLQRAIDALAAGLGRAPANPYAWARLAYAEALVRGWSPLAVSSLRMALITAPYEPRLLWSRLRMSFLAWPELSREDRELVSQQIRYAWQADPAELVRLAVELKQVDQVRAALLLSPDDSAAFEELLKK